jgi:hypothetical protein
MAVDDFLTRHPEFFIRSISNTSEGVVLAKHMKPLTLVSVPSASASLRPCIIAKYAGTCRRSRSLLVAQAFLNWARERQVPIDCRNRNLYIERIECSRCGALNTLLRLNAADALSTAILVECP